MIIYSMNYRDLDLNLLLLLEALYAEGSVTAAAASRKPTASAAAIQEFPARNVVGAAVAVKPTAAATAEQEFTERYVEAAIEDRKSVV